jgi:hypothetical protein
MKERERRRGEDRRIEDLPVVFDRRIGERRTDDLSRRSLMDRRVQTVPVENDRRQGSRRSAELEAAKDGKEVVPDWMEEALAEAAQRQEEMPAMSPPPVDTQENLELELRYHENRRGDYNFEIGLAFFTFFCLAGTIYVLFFT